jgi:DNA-binding MarR family transcriptional regulator
VSEPGIVDPSEPSRWRPLWDLQRDMSAEIGRIYTDAHVDGLKPSYVRELLLLYSRGPMTITELAQAVQRTHSAMSQKVAAMRAAGLVRTGAGADARSKMVALTAKSRRIAGLLAAEWQATEAALAELEAELPYPVTQVVGDVSEALARRSFYDRITAHLAKNAAVDWKLDEADASRPAQQSANQRRRAASRVTPTPQRRRGATG